MSMQSEKIPLETKQENNAGSNREMHVFYFACVIYVPLVVLATSGVSLTQSGLVRGDSQALSTAFVASIALPVIDMALIIVYSWCMCQDEYSNDITPNGTSNYVMLVCLNLLKACKFLCAFFGMVLALIGSAIIELGMVLLASYATWGDPLTERAGCINGFGCANIVALMIAGVSAIHIVVWLFIAIYIAFNHRKLENMRNISCA